MTVRNLGHHHFALRVAYDSDTPAYHLHVEEWAAAKAREVGVSTVLPILTDTSRYVVPFDFQVLPWLQGKTLIDADDETLKQTFVKTAANLAKLHTVTTSRYGPFDPRPLFMRNPGQPCGLFDEWADYLTVKLENHIEVCLDIGAIVPEEVKTIRRLFSGLPDFQFSPTLLHGDCSRTQML